MVTEADYLADLQAICTETTTGLDALPEPPEQISVTDFATSAADLLDTSESVFIDSGTPTTAMARADDSSQFDLNRAELIGRASV